LIIGLFSVQLVIEGAGAPEMQLLQSDGSLGLGVGFEVLGLDWVIMV
jgi:hypothetical protein